MNPQFLPPQPRNFNPPANGFPPRPNNPQPPVSGASKNGPSPLLPPSASFPANSNVPLSNNSATLGFYPPQKNMTPFSANSAPDQSYFNPANPNVRPQALGNSQGPSDSPPMLNPTSQQTAMPPKPEQFPPSVPGHLPTHQQNQLPHPGGLNSRAPPHMQQHIMPPLPVQQKQQQPHQMSGQSLQQQQQHSAPMPVQEQSNQNHNMPPMPPKQQHVPLMPSQQHNPMPSLQQQPLGQPMQQHMPPFPAQQKQQQQQHMQSQGHPMQQHMPPLPMQPKQQQMPPQPLQQQIPPPMSGQHFLPGQPIQHPPIPGAQKMPPFPGQQQQQMPPMPRPGQFQNPPMPNRMPPLPGQHDQLLTNQMQNVSLSGPGQGGHMPPQGYAQQPGYPAMGQPPAPMGYQQQPQQQQKRLDPDQMPSVTQVIEEDQLNRSGPFVTNQKGLVPPLVTTNFTVQDQGNASPRFIRSTMYNVPITQDIMKQCAIPFSLVLSPMARLGKDEFPPPIVNFGDLGPVRCIRCKAYMCPFMQFIDSGRRFQCLFCKATTDVPTEYFQHLDHTGQRMDKYERPELVLGTYEFVATADYCRNNILPKPPAMIFIIDVSYNNIKSGLVHLLCSRMKEIIQNLPVDQGQEKSNMRVGFITYNSSVHFYNIKGTLAAPQMMVVGDTQEMFMPLLDGFLCTPEESEAVIDSLMEQIPAMFGDTKETEIVLLPAILAGLEALKASETTGKLLVFHSTLPTSDCPGALKNRDDRKLLGTDKEKTVLTPQTQAYNQLGQDCVAVGCSVDLFIFNNSYIDIATISQVSRLTGGEVFKYTYFQADIDGDRLIRDVIMDISRPIAFDGIMRVRTSTGTRPTDFYGYFFMSNTTDVELAALDCDKGIAIEIKHDDKLSEDEGVYIQAALLYTSCSGQRRLRIMNLSLKACSQMGDLYRSCDLDTLINYLSKQATYKLLEHSPKAIKDGLVNRGAQILACYRKNCATPSSAGQLILPECMKLLPVYINCLLKSDALSGGSDMTIDDRSFAMQAVLGMDVATSVHHFYPRLIPLLDLDTAVDPVKIPTPIRCTIEKMNEQGVYVLENAIHMFLWVGLGVEPGFVQNVFGVASAIQIDIKKPFLPELDNPLSIAVRKIIDEIRTERHRCLRLTIVRQKEKLEPVFKHFLVEDRGTDGSASYVDFLCHMHKEIRNLLS